MLLEKEELEQYLWNQIPISKAMKITVEQASSAKIVLAAPLSNNINHKKTVFGGSLHAVATLTCWSLIHYNLIVKGVESFQIVISHSEIDFLQPVSEDFKVECERDDPVQWNRFLKIYHRMGKARLKLSAKILKENQLCVNYVGIFVVINTQKLG
jgi:thioesterase domain-containing protein